MVMTLIVNGDDIDCCGFRWIDSDDYFHGDDNDNSDDDDDY
jgi:hypothetical protein